MAQKKQQTRHVTEVAGIILLGFAIFLMWCLINYDPRDPSFGTGVSAIPKDLWKRGGRLGSYLASLLFLALTCAAQPAAEGHRELPALPGWGNRDADPVRASLAGEAGALLLARDELVQGVRRLGLGGAAALGLRRVSAGPDDLARRARRVPS